jgi:hypothetical protein
MHRTEEKFIKISSRRTEEKILLGRPRRRWEYNIKINLKGI